ncbi:MAG TPA: DUF4430 domain-containing protein [Solirubrobacteraceae bacterium]
MTAALVLISAAGALAAKVNVRIEGKTRTLLSKANVPTRGGFLTRGGAPAGACPATSAAGALNVATKGRWGATFKSSLNDYELTSVLGERWTFTSPNYWAIWVNGKFASVGMCEIKLKRNDHLLFAVDPLKHPEHPLRLTAPSRARAGRAFTVTVNWLADNGKGKPLSGVRIMGATTNKRGRATITATKRGRLRLKASKTGYIRSAVAPVSVSG